jgi:hypothetical protein
MRASKPRALLVSAVQELYGVRSGEGKADGTETETAMATQNGGAIAGAVLAWVRAQARESAAAQEVIWANLTAYDELVEAAGERRYATYDE